MKYFIYTGDQRRVFSRLSRPHGPTVEVNPQEVFEITDEAAVNILEGEKVYDVKGNYVGTKKPWSHPEILALDESNPRVVKYLGHVALGPLEGEGDVVKDLSVPVIETPTPEKKASSRSKATAGPDKENN
jgi:hypothetical protein